MLSKGAKRIRKKLWLERKTPSGISMPPTVLSINSWTKIAIEENPCI
jgi:hypothetical protein